MPQTPDERARTYRAFISYSHRDKTWGDWLHRSLEAYRVPSRLVGTHTAHGTVPRRLIPVFRDREELASATDLGRQVNEALAESENLIVICSPASAASRWVNEEILAFKRMGRGERIFCLIVAGEPNATDMPGREAEECFCPALRFKLDADDNPTDAHTEPIAADAREGKDGKANAKLKLIAGMLGVGFDALKQREQRRQLQRMTALASVALVVMAVTIVLAVFALISRHQAVTAEQTAQAAQHVAVVAKEAAERRQKQAEDLVDFMLGDLTVKLQAESRGDILLSVDDKAMAYFQSLPTTDVTDTTLAQRAEALEKIAMVRMDQGQVAGALKAFQASAAIWSRLATAAPNDAQPQAQYAREVTWMGLIHQDKGELDDAQRAYATAQRALHAALKRAPDDRNLLEQLTYAQNDLGDVFLARGQLDAAHAQNVDMLTASQKLIARRKPNTDDPGPYQVLILAHAKLAGLATQRGDLATTIAQRRAGLAAAIKADKSIPNDAYVRVFLVEAHNRFGKAALLVGDLERGVRSLQQAVALAGPLTKTNPKSGDFQKRLGQALSGLARAQRLHGEMRAADSTSAKAITVLAALAKTDQGNADNVRDLAVAQTERGVELRAAGDRGKSRALTQAALHILEPQLAKHPDYRFNLLPTMTAKLLLASLEPDAAKARTTRERALQTMQAATVGKSDPRLLALEVQALLALDREADAQILVKQLWNQGYRDPEFVALLQRSHIAYPVNAGFAAQLAAATQAVADHSAPAPAMAGNEHR